MQDFRQILDNLAYLGYLITIDGPERLITIIDLVLVTITFFLILFIIRQSRAAVLLRGVVMMALILLAIIALLPLPTFDWLLLAALIVGLVATPMIFQPELRRGLESLGRNIGFFHLRPTQLVHSVVPVLLRAISNLSDRRTGALIVLEGETSLADIIATGVSLRAKLSADLLETIFHDKTPLHDGAVIIREDRVEAAACVLPLSEQELPGGMHQGTRHRAALGASEEGDALILVVSEESGQISVAKGGRLDRDLDSTGLRDRLYSFYDPIQARASLKTNGNTLSSLLARLRNTSLAPRQQILRLVNFLVTLVLAVLLAVAAWLGVQQFNPPGRQTFDGVELKLSNLSKEMVVVSEAPQTVALTVQAPQQVLDGLSAQSFRAAVDLAGLDEGVHRLTIKPSASDRQVRLLSTDPAAIDVELQPKASRTITVNVVIPDQDSLPFSYEIASPPTANPAQVEVQGPADLLDQLAKVEATIALRSARTTVQENRIVTFKDGTGKVLIGLSANPESVQITVPIRQAFNTRDVTVHAVITGTVASGYWIQNVTNAPQTVTLLGDPQVLDEIGGFVDTVPVDVTGAAGEVTRRVPLAPPPGVSALNEKGVSEGSIDVRVSIVPLLGNLRLPAVAVDITGAQAGDTVSKTPASVEILLAGPLPVLNQVNADPQLVRVQIDVSELAAGVHDLTPTLIVPDTLSATMLPATVQIRLDRAAPTPAATP